MARNDREPETGNLQLKKVTFDGAVKFAVIKIIFNNMTGHSIIEMIASTTLLLQIRML